MTEVETVLDSLTDLNTEVLVKKLAREPGKREARYAHLFCGDTNFATASEVIEHADDSPHKGSSLKRIEALESQVATLHEQVKDLQEMVEILSQ